MIDRADTKRFTLLVFHCRCSNGVSTATRCGARLARAVGVGGYHWFAVFCVLSPPQVALGTTADQCRPDAPCATPLWPGQGRGPGALSQVGAQPQSCCSPRRSSCDCFLLDFFDRRFPRPTGQSPCWLAGPECALSLGECAVDVNLVLTLYK